MFFRNFRFSKSKIIISVLALALIALGIFYIKASSRINDLESMVEEKENSIQTLIQDNEDLKLKVLKLTTQPTRSVNKVKPVKQVVKKKKPSTKNVKYKRTKKNGVYHTAVFNSNSPVVKLVVYESNGKKKTYTMNCTKESKNTKTGYKYAYKTKKKSSSKQNIVRR
jgi:hypothetical protein